MAANDYFKVAASNIRRAIELKRAEINELHALSETKKKEAIHNIQQKQSEITNAQGELARSQDKQDPNKDRATRLKEIGALQTEIVNVQHQLAQEQEQILNQIRNIERDLVNTGQLASSLETKS